MTITLPLPDKRLHAHASGHWRATATATKSARRLARAFARINDLPDCPYQRATISFYFHFGDNRSRDTLNAVHSCKPYVDGLVDAGVVQDDRWQNLNVGSIQAGIDRNNPRVELTVVAPD